MLDFFKHTTSSAEVQLRLRLDMLFHLLQNNPQEKDRIFVDVSERADAYLIAAASLNEPQDTLRNRIQATILKDAEPRKERLFTDAFRKVFEVENPYEMPKNVALSTAPPRRKNPIQMDVTKVEGHWLETFTPVLVLLVVFAAFFFFATREPETDTGLDDDQIATITTPVSEANTETGDSILPEVSSTGPAPLTTEKPKNTSLDLARFALLVLATTDAERQTNLTRVAEAMVAIYPGRVTKAQMQHRLMHRLAADPLLTFEVNQVTLPRLVETLHAINSADLPLSETDQDIVRQLGQDLPDFPTGIDPLVMLSLLSAAERIEFAMLLTEDQQRRLLAETEGVIGTVVVGSGATDLTPADIFDMDLVRDLAGLNPYDPISVSAGTGARASWIIYVFILILPVLLLAYRAWTFRRRLVGWFTDFPPPMDSAPVYQRYGAITRAADEVTGRNAHTRAARDLARPEMVPARKLDATRSATATARNLGRFKPIYEERRVAPRYLVIIIRQSADDIQAEQFLDRVNGFRAISGGLGIWYMDSDTNTLYEDPRNTEDPFGAAYGSDRIDLKTLWRRFPKHRILFLGTGEVFLSQRTGAPRPWIRDLLRWPFFALLTPRPSASWGHTETQLARLFDGRIYEADADGMQKLSREANQTRSAETHGYRAKSTPIWETHPNLLTSDIPPDQKDLLQLETELQDVFGDGGMRLLRAATIYPAFNWTLTIYLGQNLIDPDPRMPENSAVLDPDRLRLMATLPWFREARFPFWAVEWLQRTMSQDEKLNVRELLLRQVREAEELPQDVFQESLFVTEGKGGDARPMDPRHKRVFLQLLATGSQSGNAMKAAADIAKQFHVPRRRFWQRELFVIGALVGYGLTAAWVLPRPWAEHEVFAGDYLPIAVLLLIAAPTYLVLQYAIHAFPTREPKT